MNNFHDMGLNPFLTCALDRLGFTQPTDIQAHTIPLALQQKDVLGSAKTGTGKTLAFALPLLNHLLAEPTGGGLIITPTRELAQQVISHIHQILGKNSPIHTALIIGGEPYAKQMKQLRVKPRIIVGTPGRLIDHFDRGTLKAHVIKFLVLDETDRMFDMGFSMQLEQIIHQLPTERQTLMFSATFPPDIEKLAVKHLNSPERVFVQEIKEATSIVADNLQQEMIRVKNGADKYQVLLDQLIRSEGTVLVFVKTRYDAERLASELKKDGHSACAIHGNLRQSKRERVIKAFRQGRHRIMVGTDIVARGLDVPHVMHVINYDIPHAPEDYVHRIGRTARAGAKGFAINLVGPQDYKQWQAIQDLLTSSPKKPVYKRGLHGYNNNKCYKDHRNPTSFNRSSDAKKRNNQQGKKTFWGAKRSFRKFD
jgi:superfamily II DNA/RNA helicase